MGPLPFFSSPGKKFCIASCVPNEMDLYLRLPISLDGAGRRAKFGTEVPLTQCKVTFYACVSNQETL